MTFLVFLLPIFLFTLSYARASGPPILSKSLTSQLVPSNPAVSSAFLIPQTSALLVNASGPFPALRVPPSWSFSIGFSGSTFLPSPGRSDKLSFSAQQVNGDPIPDWLVFAPDTITFGGVTPKGDHGVQVLKIEVTASTQSDLSTSDTFTLIISPHDLSVTGPLLARNVTANNTFSIVLDDWNGVQVDGAPPNSSAVTPTVGGEVDPDWISGSDSANLSLSLDTSLLSWLTYDESSCTLSGTPPSSLAGAPLPIIPATIKLTLAQTNQYLSVFTNLTLVVVPSLFSSPSLPALSAPSGSKIAFSLSPFLTARGSSAWNNRRRANTPQTLTSNLNVSAVWEPQNATWLAFDGARLMLSGTVPKDAPDKLQVFFQGLDEVEGTISRTQMRIDIAQGGGAGNGRELLPADTLKKTGNKIKLAVGVVFGVAAGVILLACFLAICRHCCAAREHVEGAYVIDQSACDGILYKSSLEKEGYNSLGASGVNSVFLAPSPPPVSPNIGHTMTKAAFFDAVRTRFGSDGSWRTKRNTGRPRAASGNGSGPGPARGIDHPGVSSFFGSSKQARKSKISKPMALLSSSTSVRDGFAERGRNGINSIVNGKGKGAATTNFTLFGDGNNAEGTPGSSVIRNAHDNHPNVPPLRPGRPDVSHPVARVFMTSPGAAVLAYDRTRSNSDPARTSVHGSVVTAGSPGKRQSGSASAPSLGTATQSGTQSTFATGDSARLTNAAGEVPFRRPGFDGRWETLAERNMRQAGSPLAERGVANATNQPFLPSRALVEETNNLTPIMLAQMGTSRSNTPPASDSTPSKSAMSSKQSTPSKFSPVGASNMPSKLSKASSSNRSVGSRTASNKISPLNPHSSGSSKHNAPIQSGTPTKSASAAKIVSERSLAAPSTYRNVFFGDKGTESDSSGEDADDAVITHVVNRSSSETPVIMSAGKRASKPGKPRLVAFTQEKTAAASEQGPRRDVSQKAVFQGAEDSDPEAEMRIGLEYVRQLGDPDATHEGSRANTRPVNVVPSTSASLASEGMRTPSAEYYASNNSNNSIAGRSRVLAPLVISSHRNRHHAAQSMASTHDSLLSLAERESELPRESRWMVESELPRFTFNAKEPFNFAVPLDREHKYASALAGSALEAKQTDGRLLPEWLRFDKGGKEFWGVTPRAAQGESGELLVTRVVVKIWDGEKGEVVGGCIVDVFGEKE